MNERDPVKDVIAALFVDDALAANAVYLPRVTRTGDVTINMPTPFEASEEREAEILARDVAETYAAMDARARGSGGRARAGPRDPRRIPTARGRRGRRARAGRDGGGPQRRTNADAAGHPAPGEGDASTQPPDEQSLSDMTRPIFTVSSELMQRVRAVPDDIMHKIIKDMFPIAKTEYDIRQVVKVLLVHARMNGHAPQLQEIANAMIRESNVVLRQHRKPEIAADGSRMPQVTDGRPTRSEDDTSLEDGGDRRSAGQRDAASVAVEETAVAPTRERTLAETYGHLDEHLWDLPQELGTRMVRDGIPRALIERTREAHTRPQMNAIIEEWDGFVRQLNAIDAQRTRPIFEQLRWDMRRAVPPRPWSPPNDADMAPAASGRTPPRTPVTSDSGRSERTDTGRSSSRTRGESDTSDWLGTRRRRAASEPCRRAGAEEGGDDDGHVEGAVETADREVPEGVEREMRAVEGDDVARVSDDDTPVRLPNISPIPPQGPLDPAACAREYERLWGEPLAMNTASSRPVGEHWLKAVHPFRQRPADWRYDAARSAEQVCAACNKLLKYGEDAYRTDHERFVRGPHEGERAPRVYIHVERAGLLAGREYFCRGCAAYGATDVVPGPPPASSQFQGHPPTGNMVSVRATKVDHRGYFFDETRALPSLGNAIVDGWGMHGTAGFPREAADPEIMAVARGRGRARRGGVRSASLPRAPRENTNVRPPPVDARSVRWPRPLAPPRRGEPVEPAPVARRHDDCPHLPWDSRTPIPKPPDLPTDLPRGVRWKNFPARPPVVPCRAPGGVPPVPVAAWDPADRLHAFDVYNRERERCVGAGECAEVPRETRDLGGQLLFEPRVVLRFSPSTDVVLNALAGMMPELAAPGVYEGMTPVLQCVLRNLLCDASLRAEHVRQLTSQWNAHYRPNSIEGVMEWIGVRNMFERVGEREDDYTLASGDVCIGSNGAQELVLAARDGNVYVRGANGWGLAPVTPYPFGGRWRYCPRNPRGDVAAFLEGAYASLRAEQLAGRQAQAEPPRGRGVAGAADMEQPPTHAGVGEQQVVAKHGTSVAAILSLAVVIAQMPSQVKAALTGFRRVLDSRELLPVSLTRTFSIVLATRHEVTLNDYLYLMTPLWWGHRCVHAPTLEQAASGVGRCAHSDARDGPLAGSRLPIERTTSGALYRCSVPPLPVILKSWATSPAWPYSYSPHLLVHFACLLYADMLSRSANVAAFKKAVQTTSNPYVQRAGGIEPDVFAAGVLPPFGESRARSAMRDGRRSDVGFRRLWSAGDRLGMASHCRLYESTVALCEMFPDSRVMFATHQIGALSPGIAARRNRMSVFFGGDGTVAEVEHMLHLYRQIFRSYIHGTPGCLAAIGRLELQSRPHIHLILFLSTSVPLAQQLAGVSTSCASLDGVSGETDVGEADMGSTSRDKEKHDCLAPRSRCARYDAMGRRYCAEGFPQKPWPCWRYVKGPEVDSPVRAECCRLFSGAPSIVNSVFDTGSYECKRDIGDEFGVPFHMDMFQRTMSNMDIRLLPARSACVYVAKYLAKGEQRRPVWRTKEGVIYAEGGTQAFMKHRREQDRGERVGVLYEKTAMAFDLLGAPTMLTSHDFVNADLGDATNRQPAVERRLPASINERYGKHSGRGQLQPRSGRVVSYMVERCRPYAEMPAADWLGKAVVPGIHVHPGLLLPEYAQPTEQQHILLAEIVTRKIPQTVTSLYGLRPPELLPMTLEQWLVYAVTLHDMDWVKVQTCGSARLATVPNNFQVPHGWASRWLSAAESYEMPDTLDTSGGQEGDAIPDHPAGGRRGRGRGGRRGGRRATDAPRAGRPADRPPTPVGNIPTLPNFNVVDNGLIDLFGRRVQLCTRFFTSREPEISRVREKVLARMMLKQREADVLHACATIEDPAEWASVVIRGRRMSKKEYLMAMRMISAQPHRIPVYRKYDVGREATSWAATSLLRRAGPFVRVCSVIGDDPIERLFNAGCTFANARSIGEAARAADQKDTAAYSSCVNAMVDAAMKDWFKNEVRFSPRHPTTCEMLRVRRAFEALIRHGIQRFAAVEFGDMQNDVYAPGTPPRARAAKRPAVPPGWPEDDVPVEQTARYGRRGFTVEDPAPAMHPGSRGTCLGTRTKVASARIVSKYKEELGKTGKMSVNQQRALEFLLDEVRADRATKARVLLHGPPGCGKTWTALTLRAIAMSWKLSTITTALHAKRASEIQGVHLHRLFAFGHSSNATVDKLFHTAQQNMSMADTTRLYDADLLIIDELGEVSAQILTAMDMVLRVIRHVDEPFGGLMIVATGDWFQVIPACTLLGCAIARCFSFLTLPCLRSCRHRTVCYHVCGLRRSRTCSCRCTCSVASCSGRKGIRRCSRQYICTGMAFCLARFSCMSRCRGAGKPSTTMLAEPTWLGNWRNCSTVRARARRHTMTLSKRCTIVRWRSARVTGPA